MSVKWFFEVIGREGDKGNSLSNVQVDPVLKTILRKDMRVSIMSLAIEDFITIRLSEWYKREEMVERTR